MLMFECMTFKIPKMSFIGHIWSHHDLDLQPSDLKIYQDHVCP